MADTSETTPGGTCVAKLKSYVKTRKGFILAAEICISFLVIICYAASYSGGYTGVPICEMIFTAIFFVVFMMELDKQLLVVNWPWSDLIRAGIGGVLYIIIALITLINGRSDGALIAGGVFSLLAGLLFGYDAYSTFLVVKGGRTHTAAPTGV